MDELSLIFHGFNPSESVRQSVSERLSAIQDEAPYGAVVKAEFTRQNRSLKGLVSIQSSAGRFFSMADGNNLTEVLQKLTRRIRRQLDRWKSRRFQSYCREVSYEKDGVA